MVQVLTSLKEAKIIELLAKSGVGVLPTDTVYGLVCRATDQAAVERLYKLKHREHKPGTVIAASIDQLVELGIKARYLTAVAQFWPGPISIVIPSHDFAYIHQGVGSIAMRIPSDKPLCELLAKTGPLLTTSANDPGEPTAHTIQAAQNYFKGQVDFYVDGGNLSDHKPSTVIRIVDDAIEILRPGAVTIDEATGRILQ